MATGAERIPGLCPACRDCKFKQPDNFPYSSDVLPCRIAKMGTEGNLVSPQIVINDEGYTCDGYKPNWLGRSRKWGRLSVPLIRAVQSSLPQ